MINLDDYIIIGHDNPDVDSILSGILLEKIFKKKGLSASFIIPVKQLILILYQF